MRLNALFVEMIGKSGLFGGIMKQNSEVILNGLL